MLQQLEIKSKTTYEPAKFALPVRKKDDVIFRSFTKYRRRCDAHGGCG